MRKKLISKNIRHYYDMLKLQVVDEKYGVLSYKVINNWSTVSEALFKLNEFNFMGDSIDKIFKMGAAYASSEQSISINANAYETFVSNLNIVKAKCEAIMNLYPYEDDTNDLYIKLPDNLSDLIQLSDVVKELDQSFNKCPYLSEKIGEITFKRVEEGSNWLVLMLKASSVAATLKLVGSFVNSCFDLAVKTKTIKNLELDNILKKMEIDEKQKEIYRSNVLKNENEEIKSQCLDEFKKLGISNKDITPEESTRIVYSMKTLANLLELGIEIYPSESSDDTVKNLFPKKEQSPLIEYEQKLIEDEKKNK